MEPSHVGAAKFSSNGQLKVMGTERREGHCPSVVVF